MLFRKRILVTSALSSNNARYELMSVVRIKAVGLIGYLQTSELHTVHYN